MILDALQPWVSTTNVHTKNNPHEGLVRDSWAHVEQALMQEEPRLFWRNGLSSMPKAAVPRVRDRPPAILEAPPMRSFECQTFLK